MGYLKKGFDAGELFEQNMENVYETQFLFRMESRKTLDFTLDEMACYADVTSGSEGITMLVGTSGGTNAEIEPPLLIFRNKDRTYPFRRISILS